MVKPYHRSVEVILKGVKQKDAHLMLLLAAELAKPRNQRMTYTQMAEKWGVSRRTLSRLGQDPRTQELKARIIAAMVDDYVPDVLITHAKKGASGDVRSADFYWKARKDLRQEVGLEEESPLLEKKKEEVAEEMILRIEAIKRKVVTRYQEPVVQNSQPVPRTNIKQENDENSAKTKLEELSARIRARGSDTTSSGSDA